MLRPALVLAALCAACSTETPDPVGQDWLTHPGVSLAEANARAVELGWQAPDPACPQVYRLAVSYDVLPLQEENYEATLVLAPHRRKDTPRAVQRGQPVPPDLTAPAQVYYDGFRAGRKGSRRDVHVGRTLLGPASPTAACFARTWDPMEDALSLGWPQLTGRLTALGEKWMGARVEGKCNKNACIDPQTFAGGIDNHHRACVSQDWEEQLVGIFETPAGLYAAIDSTWSDGHGTAGIWTERRVIVSVDHGRPVWARTVVHHSFPQPTNDRTFSPIERTWTLEAIDSCPGSLAEAGWARPENMVDMADNGLQRMAALDEPKRRGRANPEEPPE